MGGAHGRPADTAKGDIRFSCAFTRTHGYQVRLGCRFPYGRFSQDYSIIEEKKSRCGKNVTFTGFVDDITAAYCSADVFFMPSYAEGLPMVALEAFATGLPVVARKIPEFTGNFKEIAVYFESIEEAGRLLEDRSLLEQHAALSRPFTEDYDIRKIAKLHINLYRELTGQ